MHIALVSRDNIEDKLILNLIYKNLKKKFKKNLLVDLFLIGVKKNNFDSIFYKKEQFNNIFINKFSFGYLQKVRNQRYDFSIEISNSPRSLLINLLIDAKKKVTIRNKFYKTLKNLFINNIIPDPATISKKILNEIIKNNNIDLEPDIKINLKRNNDIVKWIFETSCEQSFSKTNFIFIYYDFNSFDTKNIKFCQ